MTMRAVLARHLRAWADRLDHRGAPKYLSDWSFTFERGRGVVFREDRRGCRLGYLGGEDNYDRAHTEADNPV